MLNDIILAFSLSYTLSFVLFAAVFAPSHHGVVLNEQSLDRLLLFFLVIILKDKTWEKEERKQNNNNEKNEWQQQLKENKTHFSRQKNMVRKFIWLLVARVCVRVFFSVIFFSTPPNLIQLKESKSRVGKRVVF